MKKFSVQPKIGSATVVSIRELDTRESFVISVG